MPAVVLYVSMYSAVYCTVHTCIVRFHWNWLGRSDLGLGSVGDDRCLDRESPKSPLVRRAPSSCPLRAPPPPFPPVSQVTSGPDSGGSLLRPVPPVASYLGAGEGRRCGVAGPYGGCGTLLPAPHSVCLPAVGPPSIGRSPRHQRGPSARPAISVGFFFADVLSWSPDVVAATVVAYVTVCYPAAALSSFEAAVRTGAAREFFTGAAVVRCEGAAVSRATGSLLGDA